MYVRSLHPPSLVRAPLPVLLSLTAALLLAGCQTTSLGNERVNTAARLTAEQRAQMREAAAGNVIHVDQPYYGQAVRAPLGQTHGLPLPQYAQQASSVSLPAEQGRGFLATMDAVSEQLDIPYLTKTQFTSQDGTSWDTPIVAQFSRSFEGTLSHFLDTISTRADVFWTYTGNSILFERMREVSYQLPLPNSSASMTTSITGIDNGSGSTTFSSESNHDPWTEIEERLSAAIALPGSVAISRNAGTATVLAPPSGQATALRIVEEFREIYGKSISLDISVFYVRLAEISEFEGGLTASFSEGTISGLTQALVSDGAAILSSGDIGVSLRALATNDAVVDYISASSVSQSGVPSPISLSSTQSYVSGETITTEDSTTTSALETDEIETGISIFSLPRLVDGGNVHLSLSILQSSLASLDEFTSGDSTVQLPASDSRSLSSDVILAPGSTLILSGLEGAYTTRDNRNNFFLGGHNETSVEDVRVIFIVRPSIIPVRGGS